MKVDVFTSYFGGPYQWGRDLCEALNRVGTETHHVHTLPHRLLGLARTSGDVVHTTIPLPFRLWRKPLVVTVKGDFTIEHNVLQRFYPDLLNGADAATTPSRYLANRLGRNGIEVIPNAVFPERFPMATHEKRARLNLVTVMNFYFEGKGIGPVRILDALERTGFRDFRYIVVGDGPYLAQAKEHAKGKPRLDVRFSGFLEHPQLALSNSDLFLYYSNHDNFPNVIVEAMASGLPVLTNRVGAVAEIIDHGINGFVVDTDTEYEETLAKLLLDRGLRRAVGLAAREKVERALNWSTLVSQYTDIYRRVYDRSRS